MTKEDGGPAYPITHYDEDAIIGVAHHTCSASGIVGRPGMSLRDYFAGQALIGCIARVAESGMTESKHVVAEAAYRIADTMLEARKA